jgi:hypothetical protein
MIRRLFLCSLLTGAATMSMSEDYSGADWVYNFDGQYTIANANAQNLNVISTILGAAFNLSAQLDLIHGTTGATDYSTSISQSSLNSMSVNDLQTEAFADPGLVPALGLFVFELLDFSDGVYAGSMAGTSVTLTEGSLITADLFALADTRVAGTGLVLDLRAAVPTSTLQGTLTGINSGITGPFGDRAYFIDGQSGVMQTIALEARARAFVGGVATTDSGYLSVGAIVNSANDWSLSRNPVPEPSSMAVIGLGLLALRRRLRRG